MRMRTQAESKEVTLVNDETILNRKFHELDISSLYLKE
jgi:hypothetical protein